MTQCCMLVLLMTFVFLRMTLWIKAIYAIAIIMIQIHGVMIYSQEYYTVSYSYI